MNNIFLYQDYEGKDEQEQVLPKLSSVNVLSPRVNTSLSEQKLSEYSSMDTLNSLRSQQAIVQNINNKKNRNTPQVPNIQVFDNQ